MTPVIRYFRGTLDDGSEVVIEESTAPIAGHPDKNQLPKYSLMEDGQRTETLTHQPGSSDSTLFVGLVTNRRVVLHRPKGVW